MQENEFEDIICNIVAFWSLPQWVNSLWPSDAIWQQEIWVNIGSGNGLLPDGTKYNMTVWIWTGNYISFTIAAGLIRLHMPGVKKSRV